MRRIKLNNKGSAIVSVMIVSTFITILATTILYVTSRNYLVKQNDYQNKITFYQAEQTLDDLKAMFAEDISKACQYAYEQTMINYGISSSSAERANNYNKAFVEYLVALWEYSELPDGENNEHVHKENSSYTQFSEMLVQQYSVYSGKDKSDIEKHIINDQDGEASCGYVSEPDKGRFTIKGVIVRYAEKGYATYITTNIVLSAPIYNWGEEDEADMDETLRMGDYIMYENWERYSK